MSPWLPLSQRRFILFDLDGTLVDSVPDLTASINVMLGAAGLAPLTEANVRGLVGDGAAALVERAFAWHERDEPDEPDDAFYAFYAHYRDHCTVATTVYPGVADLLSDLREAGKTLAVVTNKPTAFAETVVAACGLDRWLSDVVGPELAPVRKPAPGHVWAALQRLDARPADAVMVGDGTTDIASGRDAGCATVAVLWGYRSREQLVDERPDAWAEDAAALRALFLG